MEKCKKKRMEALGYLPEPIMAKATVELTAPLIQPVLRETVTRYEYGQKITMYKDELEKELYKSLYSHLGLPLA